MNKEKVISYLNVNPTNNDKTMPKLTLGFNVGVTLFVLIFVILLYRPSNYFPYVLFCVLDAIYFAFLKIYRNPFWQISLSAVGMLELTIKSFFAYIIIAQYEFVKDKTPTFTWAHALVAVLAIGVMAYLLAKFYQTYKILNDNSIKAAKKEISAKNKMPKLVAIIALLAGSPMVFVRLFREDIQSSGLSAGFFVWVLALAFTTIFTMLLPKLIVFIKFKAWNFAEVK